MRRSQLLFIQTVLGAAVGFQFPRLNSMKSQRLDPLSKEELRSRSAIAGQHATQQSLLIPCNTKNDGSIDEDVIQMGEGVEDDNVLLDDETMLQIESGQPSEWMVMKELLGINIFTYVLAAAIAFFLSMNIILGPGWLGNSIGVQNTGTFSQSSESLPEAIDLSNSDFKL